MPASVPSSRQIVSRLLATGVGALLSLAQAHVFAAENGSAGRADSGNWRIEVPEQALEAGSAIRETVWTSDRPPHGRHDRIRLHRYRGAQAPFAVLLYLPGTNMNGVAAVRDESHNLWLYLAARGVEVFALDYRTHAIAPETPMDALAALHGWDTAAFLGDIDAAAALARRQSGRKTLFVAGFSRGAFLAYAHALEHPRHLAGLAILDGWFKRQTPTGTFDAESALRTLQASGQWASDIGGSRGWASRQQLMRTVMIDPAAPSPSPDHATAGDLLAHVLQTAWGPGGLANPQGGMSTPQMLATLLHGYDRYYPAIQEVEARSIADHADDPHSPIDDRWGRLRLPLLAFASTGMGEDWVRDVLHSAKTSGSRKVDARVLDDYGHLDVLVGEKARAEVFRPILDWLCAHGRRRGNCPPD